MLNPEGSFPLKLFLPQVGKSAIEVICSQAHLAAQLQSLEVSLPRYEAEGPLRAKREARRR